MPEICLYYLAQPRSLYIQMRTTASEVLHNFFDREEFFQDNLKCFGIIAVYDCGNENSRFVLLEPVDYVVEHYRKANVLIITLTHPPFINTYQGYLQETEDFIYSIYLHVRLSIKLGLLPLGLGVLAQLIAQNILIDYGLDRSMPFRQDSARIKDILYDYLPDTYFYNTLQGYLRRGLKTRSQSIMERERRCIADISRYLQIQHLTRSSTKIYMINYLISAKKGSTHHDSMHFYGTYSESVGSNRMKREVPCRISVSSRTREISITLLKLPYSCHICNAKIERTNPRDFLQLRKCVQMLGVPKIHSYLKKKNETDTDFLNLQGVDSSILTSNNQYLQAFYLNPHPFYYTKTIHSFNGSNFMDITLKQDNYLVATLSLVDTTMKIRINTPGASVIASLLHISPRNTPCIAPCQPPRSSSTDSPAVSIISSPSAFLYTTRTEGPPPEL